MRKRLWALAGVGVLLGAYLAVTAWNLSWSRLYPEAVRTARYERIFDAAWNAVDKHYYDPDFDHARWRAIRAAYRPHVRDVTNEAELYINILQNMMMRVGESHVSIAMPRPKLSPGRASARQAGQASSAKLDGCGGAYLKVDFGFELAEVRRGREIRLIVADVRPGSSAERAGLAPGDQLRKMQLAGGAAGCPRATMQVVRSDASPREVAFEVEDRAARPSLQRIDLPSGVRVLRFRRFDAQSERWLADSLRSPPKGLVLDLRLNGGGKIWVERRMLSRFLPAGSRIGQQVERYKTLDMVTRAIEPRYEGPMVVLIGPASASASETTSAALRYHRRALLVGGETAGAVLVSRNFPLPGGGGVQVAIADFRAPDGRRLEGVGVRPDLPVVQTLESIRAGRDLPLEAAERTLLEGLWRP